VLPDSSRFTKVNQERIERMAILLPKDVAIVCCPRGSDNDGEHSLTRHRDRMKADEARQAAIWAISGPAT